MAKNTEAYKLFLTQAKDAGLLNEFSAEDLQLAANSPDFGTALLSLKQDYHKATTDEMKTLAHESANQLREKYRTMGGTGSAYGDSGYKQTLDALAGRSYDAWKQGDSYKALEKSYTAAGQKAMQDTLAQLSARTGGLASSYAGQAGQQVFSDYLNEMENAAYDRYQAENAELYNLLEAQRSAEATEYARLLDRISMGQQAEETEYKRSQAAEQQNYERGLLEREEARETVDNMIAMGANLSQIPADLLEKSGYSSGYVNAGNADYWRKNTPKASSEAVEEAKPLGVMEAMLSFGNDALAYEYLLQQGYTTGGTEQMWELYNKQRGNLNPPSYQAGTLMIGNEAAKAYDSKAGNYMEVKATLEEMKAAGVAKNEILAAIKEAKESGVLNQTDYMSLYNQYRG